MLCCFCVLYFDHNATHPLSSTARNAWLEATARYIGNPSSPHRIGARAEAALSAAREKLAAWLGCEAEEIVWTSGATESNNTAVHHFAQTAEGEAWVSAVEHPSLIAAVRKWFPNRFQAIGVNRSGVVEVEWIVAALKKTRPAFVAVMAANNETGVLQPWPTVAELCSQHRIPFLCDAAQWIGRMPATGLGQCAAVSGCAHKFGGPTGVGFLKAPRAFTPLLHGGVQEHGRRAGTENVGGVLAMIAAFEECENRAHSGDVTARVAVRDSFEADLLKTLPNAEIIGREAARLWNTTAAIMPELADGRQRWVVKLDKLGFAVSTGSACASGKEEPSHVLTAMQYPPAAASRALRFSAGWETRAADWRELLDGIARLSDRVFARA